MSQGLAQLETSQSKLEGAQQQLELDKAWVAEQRHGIAVEQRSISAWKIDQEKALEELNAKDAELTATADAIQQRTAALEALAAELQVRESEVAEREAILQQQREQMTATAQLTQKEAEVRVTLICQQMLHSHCYAQTGQCVLHGAPC